MWNHVYTALLASIILTSHLQLCAADEPQQETASDDAKAGIVYGTDHAFGIVAPPGWVLDNSAGVPQGLHAVFYPKGSSWKRSRVIMYANAVHKGITTTKSASSIIADDVTDFKDKAQTGTVTDEAPLTTKANKRAIVKGFVDKARNAYEVVAYIDEPKVVVMLVLSADTKEGARAAMPAFKRLVASYFFITSQVTETPQ